MTSAPAMTSTSLLASATVFPLSMAASTASRPAVPEDAQSTISTIGMRGDRDEAVCAADDRRPDVSRTPASADLRPAAVAIATTSGQ